MASRARNPFIVLASAVVVLRIAAACSGDDALAVVDPDAAAPGAEANPDNPSNTPGEFETGPEAGRPSFCNGIVFYASFDLSLGTERGGGTFVSAGPVLAEPQAEFGRGVRLAPSREAGAAHYFVAGEGGAAFPIALGSLSMWFRGTLGPTDPQHFAQVLYRPVASLPPAALETTGIILTRYVDVFGLVVANPAPQRILTFPLRDLAPYLRVGNFNHVVTAWRESPEGGTGPTAFMAINGGLGQVLSDASVDADYTDASPDDAGNLRVPFRAYSSSPWANGKPAVALRLGAPTFASSFDGTIDDLAVWDRILPFEEMAAVYGARAPIGAVCGLR